MHEWLKGDDGEMTVITHLAGLECCFFLVVRG